MPHTAWPDTRSCGMPEAPWPWPWIGSNSYGIQSCISHRPLSTYQMSKSPKLFCGRTNRRDHSCEFSISDTKTRTSSKNLARSNLDIVLRISSHLPAPIVNGGGDRPRKVQFLELQKPRDLDLGSGQTPTAYSRASVIDLYIQISLKSENFFRTDYRHGPLQVQGHVTQKLGQISNIRPDQI